MNTEPKITTTTPDPIVKLEAAFWNAFRPVNRRRGMKISHGENLPEVESCHCQDKEVC